VDNVKVEKWGTLSGLHVIDGARSCMVGDEPSARLSYNACWRTFVGEFKLERNT